jgi:hypothetical protein
MLVVASVTASLLSTSLSTCVYDDTPALCYDHVGQVQLYGSEWKLVTHVNISKREATCNRVLDFVIQTKGMYKDCHLKPLRFASHIYC